MKQIINNLINNISSIPCRKQIDLVLDGGAFNGSYMIGSLLYFKELEKRNILHIDRISGCSIGSLLGCLYIANKLDIHETFYKIIRSSLVKGNLTYYYNVLLIIKSKVDKNFYLLCNKRLYITFYNITKKKQIVVSKYCSNDHLFQCIFCSSYLPFIMNGELCYKDKYIDGLHPHIFKKRIDRTTLFIDLVQYNIFKMMYIKNEINNSERIVKGIMDTHTTFFFKFTIIFYM